MCDEVGAGKLEIADIQKRKPRSEAFWVSHRYEVFFVESRFKKLSTNLGVAQRIRTSKRNGAKSGKQHPALTHKSRNI